MKKKNLILSILLAVFMFAFSTKNVNALISTGVDGTIIIRWIDYGDLRNERPDEINLIVVDSDVSPIKHEQINLKVTDAIVSANQIDSSITEWKFTKRGFGDYFLSHESSSRDFYLEYSSINDKNNNVLTGYNYIDSMSTGYLRPTQESFTGSVLEEAGTLVITLVKDTLTTKNLIITYNDCEGRDNSVRNLDFSIKGENVADPILQNAYYNFKVDSSNTIDNMLDTYTKSIYISGSDAYQVGNPIINYIFEEDSQNISGRTITYKIDGDNILVTVNYVAKSSIVPFEVIWKDNNNKLGLRPESLILKAYDQNGYLEKEINLSKNNGWISNESLYENMRYSNGVPIDYYIELSSNDDYEYTLVEDGNSYKVIAKLKQLDEDEIIDDNPGTGDNIMVYVVGLLLSVVGIVISLKLKRQLLLK